MPVTRNAEPTRQEERVSPYRRAVELRLAGCTLRQITDQTGLSAPTVIRAYRSFLGEGRALTSEEERELVGITLVEAPDAYGGRGALWSAPVLHALCQSRFGRAPGTRALERLLARNGLHAVRMADRAEHDAALADWRREQLPTITRQAARSGSALVWVGQGSVASPAQRWRLLLAQTLRGSHAWLPLPDAKAHRISAYVDFLDRLAATWPEHRHVLLHGIDPEHPALRAWLAQRPGWRLIACPAGPTLAAPAAASGPEMQAPAAPPRQPPPSLPARTPLPMRLTHLQRLEAESIHILREVVAECERPVMLYSIGKDSATMLHLAKKAFHPAPPPFPLLHVDTTWKFRDMYALRERMAGEMGMELLVWQNPEAKAMGINPFDHGSQIHTDMWKTQGLKQALDHYGFDAAFGGARRDEEKSRASTPLSAAPDATRRRAARRSASSASAASTTAGTRRTSVPSCGTSTTRASGRASRSACSRCRTGPSSTSGSTSTSRTSRSCRCTTRASGRWSSATARC